MKGAYNMEIKKDMTIGELLEKACEVHGIDVEEILKELNK